MGRWAWVAGAAFLLACGGSGGSGRPRDGGAAGDGQPGTVQDAGAPDAGRPGGTTGDGGTVDGGTIDGGLPDSGPTGGTADAGDSGTPATDGGSGGPGPSLDGGVSPDGGVVACAPPAPTPITPPAECASLMPQQPLAPPVRILGPSLASPADPVCGPGTLGVDGNGLLGVMRTRAIDQNGRVSAFDLGLFSPEGQAAGATSSTTETFWLGVELLRGIGVVRFDPQVQGTLLRIEPSGAVTEQPVGMVRWMAAVPGGGTVAAEGGDVYRYDGQKISAPARITRRDESGTILWSTPVPESLVPEVFDIQVYPNSAGHVLAAVAFDAFRVRLIWLDERGVIVSSGDLGGAFSTRASVGEPVELPDRSLAFPVSPVHSSLGWTVLHDLDPRPDIPPCWLDQRRETRVFRIRGGEGYAVFHGSTFVGNETRHGLEIVTLAGESCGWVDASCGDPKSGPCDLSFASVGLDGTLHLDGLSRRDPAQCLVELWPGLLR